MTTHGEPTLANSSEGTNLIARLGGRYAVTGPGLAISAILIELTYVLGSPADWGANLVPKIAAIAIAIAVPILVVLVGNALVPAGAHGRGWLILGTFIAAGVGFGTVIGPIEVAIGLTDETQYEWRIPLGTPLVAALLCLGAVQADAWLSHRERLAVIGARRAQLKIAGDQAMARLAAWRAQVADRVKASVEDVLQGLPSAGDEAVVGRLRSLAYDVIRPMSHEVAAGSLDAEPESTRERHPIRAVGLWTAVATAGIPLLTYPITLGALGCILGMSLFGVGPGLLYGGCLALSSAGATSTARLISRSSATTWVRLVSMSILVVTFAALGSAAGLYLVGPTPWTRSVWLATPLSLVIAAILAIDAGIQSRRRDLQRSLSDLNDELAWALARTNGEFYSQRRTLTRWIHGDLQAAINAAAISIDRIRRQGEPTQEAIDDGIALIASAIEALPESSAPALADVLENITKTWRGTCAVTWQVDPEVVTRSATQPASAATMADIVVEAVANAVRHGNASRAAITIAIREEAVVITVIDNGVMAEGTPGLGTRTLDEVCIDWSRSPGPLGGTELRAVIPLPRVPVSGFAAQQTDQAR